MIQNPTTNTSTDGLVVITANSGPLRPFEFRYRRIAPSVTSWSSWTPADTPNGRSKTYNNLSAGTYQFEIDKDTSYGDPHDCVEVKTVTLIPQCEDVCDGVNGGGNGNSNNGCGNVLEVLEKTGLSLLNLPEHVQFSHIDKYNVIGEGEWSAEVWIKPPANNMNFTVLSKTNIPERLSTSPAGTLLLDGSTIGPTNPAVHTSLMIRAADWTANPGTDLGNPYATPGAAMSFVCVRHDVDDSFPPSGPRGFIVTTAPIPNWDSDNFNHLVWVVKRIPYSAATSVTNNTIDSNESSVVAALPVVKEAVEFWCNGARIDTLWVTPAGLFGAGKPNKSSFSSASDRDFAANMNNLFSPFYLFGRPNSLDTGGGTPGVSAPTSGQVTNFRLYSRTMSQTEIQNNYFRGCHGEPYECAQLLIYAPLDQTDGSLTVEKVNLNHGKLRGFAANRINKQSIGTNNAAWVNACCPQTEVTDLVCASSQCNPDYVEMSFIINGEVGDLETSLVMALTLDLDACPTPSSVASASFLETLGTIYLLGSGGTGTIATSSQVADAYATAFNAVFNTSNDNQIYARANLNKVTIRLTSELYSYHCNRIFSVCLYSGTVASPTAYAGGYSISYPNNNQISICCLPENACDISESPIVEI